MGLDGGELLGVQLARQEAWGVLVLGHGERAVVYK